MNYKKIDAIAKNGEVVNLETIKNGVKQQRSVAFKDVPMELEIKGNKVTITLNEVIRLLYNEIDKVRHEIKVLENELKQSDERIRQDMRKIAEQVDKITVHLNQEGSVVGW